MVVGQIDRSIDRINQRWKNVFSIVDRCSFLQK